MNKKISRTRLKCICVYVDDERYEIIRRQAKESGRSMSNYCLMACLETASEQIGNPRKKGQVATKTT